MELTGNQLQTKARSSGAGQRHQTGQSNQRDTTWMMLHQIASDCNQFSPQTPLLCHMEQSTSQRYEQ